MDDLMVRTLREDIVKLINGVPLSLEIKRLVVKEIYNEIADKADEAIGMQLKTMRETTNEQSVQQNSLEKRTEC